MRAAGGLLLLLAGACGGEPPSPEPAADIRSEPAAETAAEPAAVTGVALVGPGGDPPLLPPRALDQEEERLELVPWKRLDLPPDFEAVVPWQEAHRHIGKQMAVEGRIVRTYNSGRACFLNFAEDWKGKFHGVIFASSFPEFSGAPEDLFLDRRIRLIGRIGEHQGSPQIVVEEPRQIVLLDG